MLKIIVGPKVIEQWDEINQEFLYSEEGKEVELSLEHSLISLTKWEEKWHKPFLVREDKTLEETLDYIKCMTLNKNIDDEVFNRLSSENIRQIQEYIADPMTATTFSERSNGLQNHEIVTSELIYYWMVALNIPFECQKWHINKLLTLIRVCNIKNEPPKKMSQREIMSRNAALNAARKKKLNTKG